jgi:hypothetical protein
MSVFFNHFSREKPKNNFSHPEKRLHMKTEAIKQRQKQNKKSSWWCPVITPALPVFGQKFPLYFAGYLGFYGEFQIYN